MSESTFPHRVLHLVIDGLPTAHRESLEAQRDAATEVFPLTEANAAPALEKIFAADTVMVWGALEPSK